MPRTAKGSAPSYLPHASGQARVIVRDRKGRRRAILLGRYGSPESKAEYQRVLALLTLHNGVYPFPEVADDGLGLTVDEVIDAWWSATEKRLGPDSKELKNYKYALRPLRRLYGTEPAAKFSPKCLRAVRQRMVDIPQYQVRPADVEDGKPRWLAEERVKVPEKLAQLDNKKKKWVKVEILGRRQALSRNVINRNVVRIRAIFSWAVAEELIPSSVAHGLREVKGLQRGDRQVKESPPRPPAFWADVEKVIPFCTKPVAAMLQLQWLTGMRSGEVRVMRTMDIDRTDPLRWKYRPGSDAGPYGRHKNAWRGQERVVALGPQCIELLAPWVREEEPEAYLFSPKRFMAEERERQKAPRKTPMTPSQLARKKKARPKRAPKDCYNKVSYPQNVRRACVRAGIAFQPYALRHGRKMDLAREYGSDAARPVLGQKSIDSTEHYGEIDQGHAQDVMDKIG